MYSMVAAALFDTVIFELNRGATFITVPVHRFFRT